MYVAAHFLPWLGFIAVVFGDDQTPINGEASRRHNVTLNFDDLPTNCSGIGFHPSLPATASFSYKDVFLESFTVKNVAKALPDLASPLDLMCASSAPNAIFGKRVPGYPWPHISLPDLALPPDHSRANVTFNLNSLMLSTTGNITGDADKTLAQITMMLMKLPPDMSNPSLPPAATWPGLLRGQPGDPVGQRIFQIGIYFGVGAHQSIKVDLERLKKYLPGFGEGVDIMEIYAEVLRLNKSKNRYEFDTDWEFCMDDIRVEIVDGASHHEDSGGDGRTQRVFLRHLGGDLLVDGTELGDKVLKDLGRLGEDEDRSDH